MILAVDPFRPLKKYQKKAKQFIIRHDGCVGLFMAPGTGKTLTAIRYIRPHWVTLVICRRDDFLTWELELKREGYTNENIAYIEKSNFDSGQVGKDIRGGNVKVVMMTYGLMADYRVRRFVQGIQWDLCVADECHYLKRWKAKRTKSVIAATCHIPRRIASTGTPITNEPLDVFSIGLFIDGGKTFGTKEWNFKLKYYVNTDIGWVPRRNSKELIGKKLKEMSFHVHEDDVLKDLPPKRRLIEWAHMSGAQRKHYERVLDTWEYELKGKDVVELDQAITRLEKLRQISSGFLYHEKKAVWFKSYKFDKLFHMLKDKDYLGNDTKVVIWCARTAEILRIARMARDRGIGAVKFYGSDAKRKRHARLAFKNDDKIRLFIGQVDSGVGINELTVARATIYVSNSFKVVSRQQSERRTRRIGSEHHESCVYYDLCTERSLDPDIRRAVLNKMDYAQNVLDLLKQGQSLREIIGGAS